MPQTFEDGFVAAHSASEAVDRLAALHQQATQALSSALKRYLKDLEALLAPLSAAERKQLAGLLRKLLLPQDRETPGGIGS